MSFERFEATDNFNKQASEEQMRHLGEERLQRADNADQQATDWVDRGVIDVPVRDLPKPDDITGPGDFKKESMLEMREGFDKLAQMKPAIDQDIGRNGDYWRSMDQNQNLDYREGYQKIYESFYGDTSVRVDKVGDTYDVINGRHRIWLAHEMGLNTIPARVIEKV